MEDKYSAWLVQGLAKAAEPPRDPAEILPDHHLRLDLAVDSLAFIELLVEFEEDLGVRLDESDLLPARYETVYDLIEQVNKRLTER